MRPVVRAKMMWNQKPLDARMEAAIAKGMDDAIKMLLEEGNRVVPHDTGDLMRSGQHNYDPRTHTASITYGDDDAPYALLLHEDAYGYHFREGRIGHWLKVTWENHGKRAMQHVHDTIKRMIP